MMLTLHGLRFCTTAPAATCMRSSNPEAEAGQQLEGAAWQHAGVQQVPGYVPLLMYTMLLSPAARAGEMACAPPQGRRVSAAVLLLLPGPAEPGPLPLQLHGWEQGTHEAP